jgi:hypothetical protein
MSVGVEALRVEDSLMLFLITLANPDPLMERPLDCPSIRTFFRQSTPRFARLGASLAE